jgi:hypothetical protein
MDIIYYIFYYLFYKFSGAHNKPESDSKYTDTYKIHQSNIFYRVLRWWESIKIKKFLKTDPLGGS